MWLSTGRFADQMARRTSRTNTPPRTYPTQTLKVGMRVGWSRAFIWNTSGGDPTDDRWRWRGTVTAILGHLAHVKWDHDPIPWMCAVCNLAREGTAKWAD